MKLVILDRDGVINYDSPGYIKSPEEWIAIPGSIEAIARMTKHGITLVVCSNQSGLGRGLFTEEGLQDIHAKMIREVEAGGGKIAGIFYCPHIAEDNCNCRKPKTQMLANICQQFQVKEIQQVTLVGDSLRDILAIKNFGGIPVLVRTGNGIETQKDATITDDALVFDDLLAFSNYIINL